MDEQRLQRLLAVGRGLVAELDLETLLAQVLDAAREVTGARYAALGILDARRTGLERFVTSGIDPHVGAAIGDPPRGRGVLGVLIEDPRPLRLHEVGRHPHSFGFPAHHPPMHTFLGVPVVIHGAAWGNLYLTEKDGDFTAEDEQAVVVLADWAALAIANAQRVARDTLRRTIDASDEERKRFARELHDGTLQDLGGLRMALSAARRSDDPAVLQEALGHATEELARSIGDLRALITELRPASLDELGLGPALEALAERLQTRTPVRIELDLALSGRRLHPDIEATAFRLVQEALGNVIKHARGATRVTAEVIERGAELVLAVRDDGAGFATGAATSGFGLLGMRERVALVGGRVTVASTPGAGTTVTASLPTGADPGTPGRPPTGAPSPT